MSTNKILVPTNFSHQAEIAFRQSVYFSLKTNSELYLLHVIPKGKKNDELSSDNHIELVQKKLDKYITEARKNGVENIFYRIECGKVFPQVLESEKFLLPDFIFLGTDVSKSEISSITLRLIDNVNCPIVIFRGRFNNIGCANIVLPLDLTKETKQKIALTTDLAKIYGSTVHIVSVTSFSDGKEYSELEKQIEQVEAVFVKEKINCTIKLIKTKNDVEIMANAINDYADDINSDLIIIMTRQEKKIQKFFVGSMATKLIKKANAPILCVSPKTAEIKN
ncbi:MAG: universal stress protein [Bacteroidales bacterium]|jgi:nucleotide-binding universal stress UspA family protein|nr:universal stress protein [Bacteroidales bacterium]